MAGDVKVPGVGEVPKTAVFAGVAVVVVLVIMYYRSHSSSSSSSSPSSLLPLGGSQGAASSGTQGAYMSGGGYYGGGMGAYASQGSYLSGGAYPWDGTQGNPNDPYSLDPATGATYGDSPGYSSSGTAGPPFTTNAEWSQYAQNYLTGTVGLPAGTVSSALGSYLSGQPVTPAQKDIIDQATGIAGSPPVTGPGGYPPSIRLSHSPSSPSGPGSGAASPGSGVVPNVMGLGSPQAVAEVERYGFRAHFTPGTKGTVVSQSPAAGSQARKGTTVDMNRKEISAAQATALRKQAAVEAKRKG